MWDCSLENINSHADDVYGGMGKVTLENSKSYECDRRTVLKGIQ